MHSYQHNIKTFNSATMHLTHVERALYRCLIELYYDTEQPLPADNFDRLARRVMAVSEEEKNALRFVLGEFFEKTGDVYTHDFCDEVIEKYHEGISAKARAGKASAEARKLKADARKQRRRSTDKQKGTAVEQVLDSVATEAQQNPTNHKPETNNHKPLTNKNTTPPDGDVEHETSFALFWDCYPRKTSKAQAEKAWKKIKLNGDLIIKILENIDLRIASGEWALDRKDFIPHPATYLNNKRWNDEIIARSPTGGGVLPFTGNKAGFIEKHTDRDWAKGL